MAGGILESAATFNGTPRMMARNRILDSIGFDPPDSVKTHHPDSVSFLTRGVAIDVSKTLRLISSFTGQSSPRSLLEGMLRREA